MDEQTKYRHNLKGAIRRLRLIIDMVEEADSNINNTGLLSERYFKDFETNLEQIKENWICYKTIMQKDQSYEKNK